MSTLGFTLATRVLINLHIPAHITNTCALQCHAGRYESWGMGFHMNDYDPLGGHDEDETTDEEDAAYEYVTLRCNI